MPVRKIAKTVRAALRDAADARHAATDPRFRRGLQKDRRSTLRAFDTVEHAIQDREKAAKAGPGAVKATPATKAKAKKK